MTGWPGAAVSAGTLALGRSAESGSLLAQAGRSVSAVGQSLFDPVHLEFIVAPGASTQVRRSVHLRLGW